MSPFTDALGTACCVRVIFWHMYLYHTVLTNTP